MAKKNVETKLVAVLDDNNRLVGSKRIPVDQDGIDFGDLVTDGRMKWNAEKKAFYPLGTDFGKIKTQQPHSNEFVIYRLMEALRKVPGFEMPIEADQWGEWYNGALKQRDMEFAARPK